MALLAVSHQSLLLHRLLSYGSSFVPRFIFHRATMPLKVAVAKDSSAHSSYTLQAGSLLLSRNGVCFVGNLNTLNKATIQVLQNVLENGCINADIPHQSGDVFLKPVVYPLTCQIWAIMEPAMKMDTAICQETGLAVSNALKPLSESFGILFEIETTDKTVGDILAQHTLRIAREDTGKQEPQEHILKHHIEKAREVRATFSPSAEQIIHGYFVGSRRVRKSRMSDTEIPLMAVKTVSFLAKSHAQLNLRSTVLEADVVMAIMIYEESITAKVGYSLPSLNPTEHKSCNNCDMGQYLEAEVRKLTQFQKLLQQFIENYAGDVLEPAEE